jgi:hypothetical protein
LAGALAGAIGVLTWNFLLKTPAGIEGLVIGVFCNLIAFVVANKLSIRAARARHSWIDQFQLSDEPVWRILMNLVFTGLSNLIFVIGSVPLPVTTDLPQLPPSKET